MLVPPLHFCANGSPSGLCQLKELRCIHGHLSFLLVVPSKHSRKNLRKKTKTITQAKQYKQKRKNGRNEKGKKRKNFYPLTSFTTGCPSFMSCRTKKERLILQSGIYNLLTNISEGTAFLLQGLTYNETLQFENKK